jgi:RNA polymerase sigma-70 factor, ECF subfamily
MSDIDLARRVLAGDESACEAFFADYFPRLYRFAHIRLGGDDQGAEEVVQTTLIRAVRKLDTYRGEAALFTWLCTLCRRDDRWTKIESGDLCAAWSRDGSSHHPLLT